MSPDDVMITVVDVEHVDESRVGTLEVEPDTPTVNVDHVPGTQQATFAVTH
jgi:hypothetical protein